MSIFLHTFSCMIHVCKQIFPHDSGHVVEDSTSYTHVPSFRATAPNFLYVECRHESYSSSENFTCISVVDIWRKTIVIRLKNDIFMMQLCHKICSCCAYEIFRSWITRFCLYRTENSEQSLYRKNDISKEGSFLENFGMQDRLKLQCGGRR